MEEKTSNQNCAIIQVIEMDDEKYTKVTSCFSGRGHLAVCGGWF
jgi:hypothetical protein